MADLVEIARHVGVCIQSPVLAIDLARGVLWRTWKFIAWWMEKPEKRSSA